MINNILNSLSPTEKIFFHDMNANGIFKRKPLIYNIDNTHYYIGLTKTTSGNSNKEDFVPLLAKCSDTENELYETLNENLTDNVCYALKNKNAEHPDVIEVINIYKEILEKGKTKQFDLEEFKSNLHSLTNNTTCKIIKELEVQFNTYMLIDSSCTIYDANHLKKT